MSKTIAEHARDYLLEETDFTGLMQGDASLLHDIAERAGMKHESWRTEKKVLDAMSYTKKGKELFEKKYILACGRWRRVLDLRES